MRGGRFACVALPIILTIGAIIAFMVATLSGIAHNSLYIFSINLENLNFDSIDIGDIAGAVGLDDVDLPDGVDDLKDINLDDIEIPSRRAAVEARQDSNGIASTLDFGNKYEVTLWGYCEIRDKRGEDGTEKKCIDGEYNWASKHLDTSFINELAGVAGADIQVPDEIDTALGIFKTVTRYTEIAFIVALAVLGLELFLGIFASCTRIISCLVWLIGIAAIVLCIVAAGLATAMGAVVVGAVEATAEQYGVRGSINTNFLVCIWIGAAFAIAASLFWLFTICCCKPEHGRHKNKGGDDNEKLMPTGGYYPVSGTGMNDHEMTPSNGAYNNQGTYHNQFNPGYGDNYSHAPSYYSGGRSDAGYEPYSHRN